MHVCERSPEKYLLLARTGRSGATFHTAGPVTAIDLSDYSDAEDADVIETVLYKSGMTMVDVEKAAIEGALQENDGNRRKAAEALGIGERTLYRKIREYGLG